MWFAPEYGIRPNHIKLAKELSTHGIEVWQTDVIESLFLTHNTQSIKELKSEYLSQLIKLAHQQTGKKIVVLGDSYAAIPVLKSIHHWQITNQKQLSNVIVGAILFSPYAYSFIPSLGQVPEYMPIIDSSNTPIMIYQAKTSGNITQFNHLISKLQQHNNPVYSQVMGNIRSLFYKRMPTPTTKKIIKKLPFHIKKMIKLLDKTPLPTKAITKQPSQQVNKPIDSRLKEFKGELSPININLKDAFEQQIIKKNYKGQITLINFWATWCPPCVEEIPSLNRLGQKMSDKPFEIISINYAEDKKTIVDFMKKIKVDFPVLLDKNGDFSKQWRVIAFPSTFVIDPQGKIRYGVNAAIEWDNDEVINVLKKLY